jgi:ADP-heptose:LPS heptosyltransferase
VDTVLIFRIGSLGDTIVALPCFHQIARSFADCRRIVVTDIPVSQKTSTVESILVGAGLIDGAIYFPPPPRRLQDFRKLRSEIKATGATTLVYVADRAVGPVLRDLLFFYGCGIRRIIGAPLSRDLQRLRIDPITGHTEREAERLARCIARLGEIDLTDSNGWDLRLQPRELEVAAHVLAPLDGRPIATISIGGKAASKDWGDANWSALLHSMARRYPNLALAFIGSADEFDRAAGLAACWPAPTLNLCGRLAPRESAATMQQALFYLGHDCGAMHLAAAVGIPCIALFGDVNMPKWWYPMGSHHHILHDGIGVQNMSPAVVLAAVDAVMHRLATENRCPALPQA